MAHNPSILTYVLTCLPLAALCQQTVCPSGADEADPPSSKTTLWYCDNFPIDDPLSGCDWERSGISWGEDHIEAVDDPTGDREDKVLRIFYPEGSYAGLEGDEKGGTNFYSYGFDPVDTAYIEYDLRFSDNFEWVAGGKLPGFYGGEGQCSGGVVGDCFSSRFMWRADGEVEIYAYLPLYLEEDCGQTEDCWFCDCDLNVCNFEHGHSFGRGSFTFQQNKWYRLSQYIKLNDPGQSNGEMQLLVDDEVVYRIIDLKIRSSSDVQINAIYFSTFFGGSDPDKNPSAADCYTYYKNIKVFY